MFRTTATIKTNGKLQMPCNFFNLQNEKIMNKIQIEFLTPIFFKTQTEMVIIWKLLCQIPQKLLVISFFFSSFLFVLLLIIAPSGYTKDKWKKTYDRQRRRIQARNVLLCSKCFIKTKLSRICPSDFSFHSWCIY